MHRREGGRESRWWKGFANHKKIYLVEMMIL
jgi:hypothetical protein